MGDFDYFNWLILPLFIMVARAADVALATLRSVAVNRGHRSLAIITGFFEAMIWIAIVSQIIKNVDNPINYIAWGIGFSGGIYVGMIIEQRMALGVVVVRIITNQNPEELLKKLLDSNFGSTVVDGQGSRGPVKIIYTLTSRKKSKEVEKIIADFNPATFYSVEDLRAANAAFAKQDLAGSFGMRG